MMKNKNELTHIDQAGNSRMVDILSKPLVKRIALAQGFIKLSSDSLMIIENGQGHKGDILSVAQLAGIMGCKKTGDLIPLCHPINRLC